MKKNFYMFQKCFIIILLFLQIGGGNLSAQTSGEFPYFESFLSETKPVDIETPTPGNGMANSVEFKKYGVQLTPPSLDKFGAIYLDNHEFQSNAGIFISFEYMIYDGDGGDGFSLFFFDSKERNPGIGAPGAGIGYAYNRSVNNDSFRKFRSIGLGGAYLGIAFDSYGNFKGMRYQGESRVNGIPFGFGVRGTGATTGGNGDNDVTLRGAMNPAGITTSGGTAIPGMGVGYGGYPVLVTQSTTANIGFRLETSGYYTWARYDQLRAKSFFKIRGGTMFSKSTDSGYRKAFVELFPNPNTTRGGFLVSVMIQNETSRDTIIYDYEYQKEFYYLENAITNSSGDNYAGDDPLFESPSRKLIATVPASFKIGFAAATGTSVPKGKNDAHVIKNLNVILPRSAKAQDDFVDDIPQRVPSVTIYPLLNDFGYKGTISRYQDPCPECIDEKTFRFVQEDGTPTATPFEHTVSGEGKWKYDQSTGIVTFEPLTAFVGEARVKYDIKGGKEDADPYALDAYRSAPATIRVNIISNTNPVINIITNKMVTGKFKK